jgi:outer membrane lipoprotein-sorting protein
MRLPITILLVLFSASAALVAAPLEQVLSLMDKTAATFRDMSAKLTRVDFTAVIKDTSRESGSVRMKRAGAKDVRMKTEFGDPDPRTIVFEKDTARIYYPKMQTVQVYDLGKQRSLVDQFLLLGFGSSGTELTKTYSIKAAGEEQIAGAQTTRLELTPKNPAAREHLKSAELWITPAGYPVQQKFHRPSGDYTLITYTDVQINTGAPDDAFRLVLPKGVKTEHPQK